MPCNECAACAVHRADFRLRTGRAMHLAYIAFHVRSPAHATLHCICAMWNTFPPRSMLAIRASGTAVLWEKIAAGTAGVPVFLAFVFHDLLFEMDAVLVLTTFSAYH